MAYSGWQPPDWDWIFLRIHAAEEAPKALEALKSMDAVEAKQDHDPFAYLLEILIPSSSVEVYRYACIC
jgi:hypothetical protein